MFSDFPSNAGIKLVIFVSRKHQGIKQNFKRTNRNILVRRKSYQAKHTCLFRFLLILSSFFQHLSQYSLSSETNMLLYIFYSICLLSKAVLLVYSHLQARISSEFFSLFQNSPISCAPSQYPGVFYQFLSYFRSYWLKYSSCPSLNGNHVNHVFSEKHLPSAQ